MSLLSIPSPPGVENPALVTRPGETAPPPLGPSPSDGSAEVTPPYSIGTPVIPPIGPGPEPIVKVTPPLGWQPEAETAREIAALMFDPGGDGGRARPPSNLPQEHENTKREQDRVTGNREELLVTVEHFIWTVARQMGEEVLQQDAQRLAEVLAEMAPKRSLALAQRLTRLAEIGALTAHDLSFMAQVLSRPGLSAETKARFLELAEISLEQRYAQAAANASLALLTAPLRLLAWADDATSSAWAVEERTLLLDNWLAGLLGVSYTESDDGLALQVSTLAILSMALPPLKGGVSAARGGAPAQKLIVRPWIRGSHANVGRVPDSVRIALDGRSFSSWDEFRGAFWRAVVDDPNLVSQFSTSNVRLMQSGRAPIAHSSQHFGSRIRYELHHITPVSRGGSVYGLDNILVVTPRYHHEILWPPYHYGGRR